MKRKKSGLAKILGAVATLILPSCYVKNVTPPPAPLEQDPVTTMTASSHDGSKVAFKVPFGNDLEAMVHKNGILENVSKDPDNSDTPVAFAVDKLIVKSERIPAIEGARLKIFDETETLAFQTREFTNIYDIMIYCGNKKVAFYGYDWDENTQTGTSQVYTHTIGTGSIAQLFPSSMWSGFEGKVGDTILIAVAKQGGMYTYALQSNPATGKDTLTEVGTNLDFQGGSGNLALFEGWNGSQDELLVWDATKPATAPRTVETPAGKRYDWMQAISTTGDGLVVRFQDTTTDADEFWWADPKEESIVPKLITAVQTGGQNFELRQMSRTGNHVAFMDSNSSKAYLYDAGASSNNFYDPLANVTNLQHSQCFGFSMDGKAVLGYEVNGQWGLRVVLHDPVTRTNSDLGDNQETRYLNYWNVQVTPDGRYAAIPAYDQDTGLEVAILEDLFLGQRKAVVTKEGTNLGLIGISQDSENLFFQEFDWGKPNNLHVYHIPTGGEPQKLTNYETVSVDWFQMQGMSQDESTHFLKARHRNDTSRYMKWKEGEPVAELLAFGK